MSRLDRLLRRLKSHHGTPAPPPTRDPFELIVWELVGYLADDDKRLVAYRLLESTVGLKPADILNAPLAALRIVTRAGGAIAADDRAKRLGAAASRVVSKWSGKLDAALALPFADARRELTRYPSIGEPGAERILLLSGAHPVLGLDSNALRVLQRLGYAQTDGSWATAYKQAQKAADQELPRTVPARRLAYLLLRHHGQSLCRRSVPHCPECPLLDDCPTGQQRV